MQSRANLLALRGIRGATEGAEPVDQARGAAARPATGALVSLVTPGTVPAAHPVDRKAPVALPGALAVTTGVPEG